MSSLIIKESNLPDSSFKPSVFPGPPKWVVIFLFGLTGTPLSSPSRASLTQGHVLPGSQYILSSPQFSRLRHTKTGHIWLFPGPSSHSALEGDGSS